MTDRQQKESVRTQILGYVLMAIFACIVIETLAYTSLKVFLMKSDPSTFYVEPTLDMARYDNYMQTRHPTLGWPTESWVALGDAVGARVSPAFPATTPACVSLYGDSFVFGDEVSNEVAWGNVLARDLDCRVSNFAISGFGLDQAVLFSEEKRADGFDASQVSVLGIYPLDLIRNLTRNRYFLSMRSPFRFKPRFRLSNGGLELLPLPEILPEQLSDSFAHPKNYYGEDPLLPGAVLGSIRPEFPFSLTVTQYLMSERMRSFLQGEPTWSRTIRPGHSSQTFALANLLVSRFASGSSDFGKTPLVVIFPTASSMRQFQNTGVRATEELANAVLQSGVATVDLHEMFSQHLVAKSYCRLLTQPDNCAGHLNAEGNRLVANNLRLVISPMLLGQADGDLGPGNTIAMP